MVRLVAVVVSVVLVVVAVVHAAVVVLAAVAIVGLCRGGRRLVRSYRAQQAQMKHQRAELLARAAIQDAWFQAGDPRGLYGRYTPREVA